MCTLFLSNPPNEPSFFRYASCPPLVRESSLGLGRRSKWGLKRTQLFKMSSMKRRNDDSTLALEDIILTPTVAEQVTLVVRNIR